MSVQELFVASARTCLTVGRKSLSVSQSLDLAAQVSAVNVGLKPALLYDSNSASAAQVQRYLSSLQSLQLASESLLLLNLNGNSVVVNAAAVGSHLEQALHGHGVAVVDVRHTLDEAAVTNAQRVELKSTMEGLLLLLERFQQLQEGEESLRIDEECEEWNLCTVFGFLLGFPVAYWFDQTESFENCLSMTPLTVITASATWRVGGAGHRARLYSFSIPAALQEETRSELENWRLRLLERFEQQTVLKDLSISQSTVTLPSVTL
ncbi:UPF0739 protein C1orf74 homolog [Austrofundulus limnaeus]|uniref:UPF0739 protein C1orf74 homolog n=1 Tax=Austrofundulus limnaeus TaxID=52670 RepID=A0A2I4B1U9_AUSLI|nr:PREDICTED: UPF0739 protein C1orf74 homolog [Austrofundulus limnaeus]